MVRSIFDCRAEVGLGQLLLASLAVEEPAPHPVRQVGQGDLGLEPAEGPEASHRPLRDRVPGQIGQGCLQRVLPCDTLVIVELGQRGQEFGDLGRHHMVPLRWGP